jgi:hypothetical protein
MGEFFLSFLDVSTGSVLHKKYGLGKKSLQAVFNLTNKTLSDAMNRMAADNESDDETILTISWKLRRELEYCGFNYVEESKALAFVDPFDKTWHNASEKHKHNSRAEFVRRVSVSVELYYLTILDYMHTEKGFGKKKRLHDLYAALREDYNKFLAAYLMCKPKGDAEAQNIILERQKQLEDIVLQLIEIQGG